MWVDRKNWAVSFNVIEIYSVTLQFISSIQFMRDNLIIKKLHILKSI